MSPPSLFPGVLARIRAKISEHQRENELRPAEAMAKKKSPRVFSALPKIKFNAILLGFLKKWDNLSQKNWDKGAAMTM